MKPEFIFVISETACFMPLLLLAPTGALVVMMVYYIYIYISIRSTSFFRFSLSPFDAIDVTSVT